MKNVEMTDLVGNLNVKSSRILQNGAIIVIPLAFMIRHQSTFEEEYH